MSRMTDENTIDINAPEFVPEDEFEIGLPDGFGPDDDIFADPESWKGDADVQSKDEGVSQENSDAETDLPTMETTSNADNGQEEATDGNTTPEENAAPHIVKIPVTIDHETKEVEVDIDKDLPTLYQKASATDRAQERLRQNNATLNKMAKLSKALEYDGAEDFYKGTVENLVTQRRNKLVSEGVHSAVADKMARDEYADLLAEIGVTEADFNVENKRDFEAEANELIEAFPEFADGIKAVPNEVIFEATKPGGPSVLEAYKAYLERNEKAELAKLRKENSTLKQNAEAAARAPVRGVASGGATDTSPEDPFLKGLMTDDNW